MRQNIIISKQFKSELATAISECEKDKIFVLVDETTREKCWELIKDDFCQKPTCQASYYYQSYQS